MGAFYHPCLFSVNPFFPSCFFVWYTQIVMRFPKNELIMYMKYLLSIAEVLLLLRVVLQLFGASAEAAVVEFVYVLSNVIIVPFQGIFNNVSLRVGGVVDFVAISAMIGYPIIVFLIKELLEAFIKEEVVPLRPRERAASVPDEKRKKEE